MAEREVMKYIDSIGTGGGYHDGLCRGRDALLVKERAAIGKSGWKGSNLHGRKAHGIISHRPPSFLTPSI